MARPSESEGTWRRSPARPAVSRRPRPARSGPASQRLTLNRRRPPPGSPHSYQQCTPTPFASGRFVWLRQPAHSSGWGAISGGNRASRVCPWPRLWDRGAESCSQNRGCMTGLWGHLEAGRVNHGEVLGTCCRGFRCNCGHRSGAQVLLSPASARQASDPVGEAPHDRYPAYD